MSALAFTVNGTPGAQGSKKHVGRGVMVESSKKVKPWRSDVKAAAEAVLDATTPPFAGPVTASIVFRFTRPRGHYRTGRNAHLLREGAPARPISRALGDVDKLVRSTFDALTAAGVVVDDSLFVELFTAKVWCSDGEVPGATVVVAPLEQGGE